MEDLESLVSYLTYFLALFLLSLCPLVFIFLMLRDAWNAFNRKAHWLPGQSLVLTSLTIQLLSFHNIWNIDTDSVDDKSTPQIQLDPLLETLPIINSVRVMMCVFIGYLLPGMMRSSFASIRGNIGALALSVTGEIASEVYFVLKVTKLEHFSPSPSPSSFPSFYAWKSDRKPNLTWLIGSWAILFTAIILLAFLLSCAVLAGKSIRNINSRNVSLALSCGCNSAVENTLPCRSIGDHVLKCWIVARASQPDYIMARSVFSSFVGLVVTVCVVFLLVETGIHQIKFKRKYVERYPYFLQCAFILIGWIIILFRWLTGVMYFPRDLQYFFQWEDFWTRSIVQLKADLAAQFRELLSRGKRPSKRATQESCIVCLFLSVPLYSLLLDMALCLQKIMVFLSKVCWCLCEIAFRIIRPVIFSHEKNALLSGSNISPTDENPFFKYKEALEIIRMPGEIAYSLWIANESAFKNVEKHMEEGFKKGRDSSQLIKLKEHRTGDPHDEAAIPEEKFCEQVGKKSRKMKAVSLIRFMIFYYEEDTNFDIVNDAIQAYSQAWPLMDIVDTLDPEANLVSLAADKEFDALEAIWKNHRKMKSRENPKHGHFKEHLSYKLLKKEIKDPLKKDLDKFSKNGCPKLFSEEEEAREKSEKNFKDRFYDSKEWMRRAAAKRSFYKTWTALDLETNHSMERLRCLLANVIVTCIQTEVNKALRENSSKWAEQGKENDIFELAFVAGIANVVTEKLCEDNEQPKVEAGVGKGNQISSSGDEIIEV